MAPFIAITTGTTHTSRMFPIANAAPDGGNRCTTATSGRGGKYGAANSALSLGTPALSGIARLAASS